MSIHLAPVSSCSGKNIFEEDQIITINAGVNASQVEFQKIQVEMAKWKELPDMILSKVSITFQFEITGSLTSSGFYNFRI